MPAAPSTRRSSRAASPTPRSAIIFADWPWPWGLLTHEPFDRLMMGNAGIRHVYLRLADPALQSVLAPAPPPQR